LLHLLGRKVTRLEISDQRRWLQTDAHGVTRKAKLLRRQKIMEIIRAYFRAEGFLEAEIPLLVAGTTPDAYIQSFAVQDKYLTTSTEYQIKRMIAGGFDKVYTLTKNFREAEFGSYHNPEFTMLEWARVHSNLAAIETDVMQIMRALLQEFFPGSACLPYQGFNINLAKDQWQIRTFQEIFKEHYQLELPEDFRIENIVPLAQRAGIEVAPAFQKNPGLFLSELLDNAVKKIGFEAPVLIQKWPASMTSSAELSAENRNWTTRTEIIIAGIELADGFPFLCDYAVQKAQFEKANALRQSEALPRVALDQRYLAMMQAGLPQGAGMALGIDRLCMLFTNSTNIQDVLCFSWDEL